MATQTTALDAENSDVHRCDVLVWFGDVNYRVDMTNEQVRSAIAEGRLADLRNHDQLLRTIAAGEAFYGFVDRAQSEGSSGSPGFRSDVRHKPPASVPNSSRRRSSPTMRT